MRKEESLNRRYLQKDDEDTLDYAMRLIAIKKEERPDDLDWQDICDALGLDFNKDSLRKSQDTEFGGVAVYEKMKNRILKEDAPIRFSNDINMQIQELKRERVKISDERAALNRIIRNEARQDTLHDLAMSCAKEVGLENPLKIFDKEMPIQFSDNSAILCLSDWHYGLDIKNLENTYNPQVFEERICKLFTKVKEYGIINGIEKLYVLGLGDFIAGGIHPTIRLESKESLTKQVIRVSEVLAGLLLELSQYFKVEYYHVLDNHGRIFEKGYNVDNDNFSVFIKWYLEGRLSEIENITINETGVDGDICSFSIYGKNYLGVHGHKDKVSDVVQNMSLMTKQFYDAIFIGHYHHLVSDEIQNTYVFGNGTLAGTDTYAKDIRKSSNPSQNMFIVNRAEGINCEYIIKL